MIKIAITGHRPERIKGQEKRIKEWVREQLNEFRDLDPMLICGMAQGVDQIAGINAVGMGIPLSCYFAYKHDLHPVEQILVDCAVEVRYVSEEYQKNVFLTRDRRMVDDCDVLLVVWDGIKSGGTYYTYQYALEKGKEIRILRLDNENSYTQL